MATIKKEAFLANIAAQDCPVCYEPVVGPFRTECGHVFCVECAKTWFESSHTCPSCRAPLYEAPIIDDESEEEPEIEPAESARTYDHNGPFQDRFDVAQQLNFSALLDASSSSGEEKRQSFHEQWSAQPRVHGRYPRNSLAYIPITIKLSERPLTATIFHGLEITAPPHYPVNKVRDLSLDESIGMLRSRNMLDGTESAILLNNVSVSDQQGFEFSVQNALARADSGAELVLTRLRITGPRALETGDGNSRDGL